MRVLVTGASGFIGRHLVAKLRADGIEPLALSRGGAAAPDSVAGPADLAELGNWSGWPAGLDAVVHLAAANPSRSDAGGRDLAALRRVNVEGTAAVAARAAREGVRRVIFVSSANVHQSAGLNGIVTSDPLAPKTPYAVSKMEAEAVFWNSLAATATEGCVLRPAPVYGEGGRGNVATLIKLAKLPLALPLEGLGGQRSLIAVDHVAELITLCLHAPAASGQTFIAADEGPIDPAGVVRAVRHGWGRKARLFAMPVGLFGWLARTARKGGAWNEITAPFIIDTQELYDKLGWRSPMSAEEKLKRLAAAGSI